MCRPNQIRRKIGNTCGRGEWGISWQKLLIESAILAFLYQKLLRAELSETKQSLEVKVKWQVYYRSRAKSTTHTLAKKTSKITNHNTWTQNIKVLRVRSTFNTFVLLEKLCFFSLCSAAIFINENIVEIWAILTGYPRYCGNLNHTHKLPKIKIRM